MEARLRQTVCSYTRSERLTLFFSNHRYLPIPPLIKRAREVDPNGRMWERLRLAINQPVYREDTAAATAEVR
jgi:hypothetical protein